jgi:3-hydroxyisobutyrate dehydrogenase-like beta-hydroxyacid dehydrogenase
MKPRIGMVGIGLMGQGIAHNLVSKGFEVWLLEHAGNQPLDELVAAGARTCATPQALAEQVDVVLIVVTGAPEVEAVLTQAQGLLAGLRPGQVVVDCSTSLPDTTERMGALVQAKGAMLIDAPMTRLAKDARAGRLNVLVGGDAAALETVRPVLAAFAENITHVGRLGDGHRMKLLHNFVSVGTMTLIAEAAAHAQHSGVDLATFEQVLATGGGAGAALQRLTPALLEDRTDSVPFTLANAYKDLSYYLSMAQGSGAHSRVAQGITETLQAQNQAGHGPDFVPALVQLLRQS